jgi:hypothetical protein
MRKNSQTTVAIGREREAGLDVFRGEVREIVEHFSDGHASAQVIEDIGDGDARTPNTGFPAADRRID